MVRTNLQEFVGDVHVLSNLQVGSNLFANDLAANVLTVDGSIGSTFFIGDGGLLSNIATTLNDIVANPGGNTVSNTLVFESGADATSNTAIATLSNVGISISNTEPTGEFQFAVGSNIFVNTHASNVLTVVGAIGSDLFIGDGGLLSNIATTIDQIIDQGNTVSNTLIFESGIDATSNTGIVTKKDVGISISNTEPTGEFQFGVGSNLLVNVYSSNVLAIEGNVSAEKMTLGTITVTSAYGLNHVTAQGSVTGDTISLTNATTGLAVTSNATVGGNVTAETVITSANVEVGDRLKFASNVFVDDLRVADVAANLVTYDKTTGELMDSGGLFANKLAVVSVQPPSALSANTTTIAKHGAYTVTTSSLAAYSNAWNAFDGDSAVEWLGSTTSDHVYNGGGYTYSGTSNLFAGNYIQTGASSAGEWLAIEFPYKTTLRHMKLTPPTTYQQYPASANVYATNDSLTWTELTNWSGVNPVTSSNVQTVVVNATESFKKYAMVVTKANGGTDNVALAEWKLFTESFSIDGGKVEMASSAVMGGETTMDQHGPHSRLPKAMPLKKFPEIAFEEGKFDRNDSTNTYVQAGYTVTASSGYFGGTGFQAWKVHTGIKGGSDFYSSETAANQGGTAGFIGTSNTYVGNSTLGGISGEWVKTGFPFPVKIKHVDVTVRDSSYGAFDWQSPSTFYIIGSHDGTTWSSALGTVTDRQYTASDLTERVTLTNSEYYKYYAIVVTKVSGDRDIVSIDEIEYYGYEEDPPSGDTSVDTTFTSIMNTPQTTGAQVYVDGPTLENKITTGPDATGTSATYDETGKYWELNGTLTSNIAVEANTFLEGDQPHAVSVWFNSSNLEANVSNTCVFSISDQEKLDSVNLDLQSNTWHNLTYAYQGEGGSRVTYLDGRKVVEDQAEDTFGDYPPFAMTGYSQGGYVVSASSEHGSGNYPPWKLFDTVLTGSGVSFETNGGRYDTTGAPYEHTAGVSTTVSGTPYTGDWVQVYFPFKFKVDHIDLMPQDTYGLERMPQTAIIAGSDDNVNWTLIKSITTDDHALTKYTPYIVNATRAYKYIRFIWNTLTTAGGNAVYMGRIAGQEMRFYGHRENDLVRLPDPTNVLKYPHIAMTGPAQRGYVASASSEYTDAGPFNAWEAFDGITGGTSYWSTFSGTYTTSNPPTLSYTGTTFATNVEGVSKYGEWLQIEFPHKVIYSYSTILAPSDHEERVPRDGYIVGSNDLTGQWTTLHRFEDVTRSGVNDTVTYTPPSAPTQAFKYFRLVIEAISTGGANFAGVDTWELFGTEEATSVPIQIGGGNIDKVANFRVYDKFVGEDQALEIWDAQKDEFGWVKSSMTLHKGRLGIGTTEPEGRLAVLDEPHGLEEFPPRAMTGYETYMEGHGVFRVSASSYYDAFGEIFPEWKAFERKSSDNVSRWATSDTAGYTSGAYTGSDNFTTNGGYVGEWIQIEAPYPIKLSHVMVNKGVSVGRAPAAGYILGSNNGVEWNVITNFTGKTYTDYQFTTIEAPATSAYRYLRMVVTNVTGGTMVDITEIKYFGTREQGQSVLHDGQLTLTKSLTVPRIGPALDADDTPRRDRLVVEYNTSTNPTFEGAVRDTSGRGNDGVFYGGASYDATEKAIEFPSNSPGGTGVDYIRTKLNVNQTGDITHSASIWFKTNSGQATSWRNLFEITDAVPRVDAHNLSLYIEGSTDKLVYITGSNYLYSSGVTLENFYRSWNHVVVTYDGANKRMYYNGRLIKTVAFTGWSGTANPTLSIGINNHANADQALDGSVSNFKCYYGHALTAEEVKTLYDMGRCDEGHHVVNFSKTRVGIGLGDGEAPRGALDVRGDILGGNPAAFSVAYNPTSLSGEQTIVWNLVYHNVGGGYNSSNGLFTAPVSGYYSFTVWAMTSGNTSGVIELRFQKNGSTVQQRPYSQGVNNYGHVSGTIIEYLSVGDTMNVRLTTGTTMYAASGQSYNGFSGFYLSS